MVRFAEDDPFIIAYYKKKKEEEDLNRQFALNSYPQSSNGFRAYQAKGRLKAGKLNKTEKRYQDYLEVEKNAGRIKDYWFESIKLKIADGTCWYTPDFLVMKPDDTLELHEVKACPRMFLDDAKVKVKAAATNYPFRLLVVYPKNKNGWEFQEF